MRLKTAIVKLLVSKLTINIAQKIKFSFKFPADLVTFTEAILNRKLHFLCSVFTYSATLSQLSHLLLLNVSRRDS